MPVKPMLAAAAPTELAGLPYPLLASPKLDGVRATVQGGVVLSRSLKPLPNRFVQARYGRPEFEGLDGELIVGDPTDPQCYTRTTSGVMSLEGEPAVQFCVFDDLTQVEWPFLSRLASAQRRARNLPGCAQVEHVHLSGPDLLQAFEEECVAQGFEGIMLRAPHGIYKEGRSTVKEGLLLK